jgi:hypothetical protein
VSLTTVPPHKYTHAQVEVFSTMKSRLTALTLSLGLALTTTPVFAHHSTAMYDMGNPTTVTGVVKRFEWTNPHAYIYLEAKDDKGNTIEWTVEMMSLNHLKGYGWSRDTVKAGDTITCTGGAARSGDHVMLSSIVKLNDGRVIKS